MKIYFKTYQEFLIKLKVKQSLLLHSYFGQPHCKCFVCKEHIFYLCAKFTLNCLWFLQIYFCSSSKIFRNNIKNVLKMLLMSVDSQITDFLCSSSVNICSVYLTGLWSCRLSKLKYLVSYMYNTAYLSTDFKLCSPLRYRVI